MNTEQVNIRDPFILPYNGVYYLYGTRSATTWGAGDGFDCYTSTDLEHWEGPIEIFHRPEGFFADWEYWAPECICYQGAFFLIATFGGGGRTKGVYILRSDRPDGPFTLYSKRLTPESWECLDGTVWFEGGTPWLIFSHDFRDVPDGDMCMLCLSDDLRQPVGEPIRLFSAAEAPWAVPVPFAKAEFGMDGEVYFSDGPFVLRGKNGALYMPWSSWGGQGYAVGVAVSASGRLAGPWKQQEQPLYPAHGGHGMAFRGFDGVLYYTLHYPDTRFEEHPIFAELLSADGRLTLK